MRKSKYVSYAEFEEKRAKLIEKLKKKRLEFNCYTLDSEFSEYFIRWWNHYIDEFGVVTLYDIKPFFGIHDVTYQDIKYGWTEKIYMNKNFKIKTYRQCIMCELNLPAYKELD